MWQTAAFKNAATQVALLDFSLLHFEKKKKKCPVTSQLISSFLLPSSASALQSGNVNRKISKYFGREHVSQYAAVWCYMFGIFISLFLLRWPNLVFVSFKSVM